MWFLQFVFDGYVQIALGYKPQSYVMIWFTRATCAMASSEILEYLELRQSSVDNGLTKLYLLLHFEGGLSMGIKDPVICT